MMRFRITYQKTEPLRYAGNLDLQKIWERYLRRAELPVAYSQGFHPQPRIQQACPLPLGFLSLDEKIDIYLDGDEHSPENVAKRLSAAPYPGIAITDVEVISLGDPPLTTRVASVEYLVEFFDPVQFDDLQERVKQLLASPKIPRMRRGKSYDMRPLIGSLEVQAGDDDRKCILAMCLAARPGATGRPDEVLAALGFDPFAARYTRTHLIFS
jgi:radical SAM-linked protein